MQVGSNLLPPTEGGAVVDILTAYDKVRHGVLTQNVACAGEIVRLAWMNRRCTSCPSRRVRIL
jgi:hypothetical protein